MRHHQRHYDHRGAVARNAADAVLVHHPFIAPVQPVADGGHGAGEVQHLLRSHEAGAGHKEGGDLHLGIAQRGDVSDHLGILRRRQDMALRLGAHGFETFQRPWMADRNRCALGQAEQAEGFLRQAEFVRCQQYGIIDDVQRRRHLPARPDHLDLGQRLEFLRLIEGTTAIEIDDALAVGVDADAFEFQHACKLAVRRYGEVDLGQGSPTEDAFGSGKAAAGSISSHHADHSVHPPVGKVP